jgi:hypothetical protein
LLFAVVAALVVAPEAASARASSQATVLVRGAPGDDGLRIESGATFTVDPKGKAVHVEMRTKLTNQAADSYGASYVRRTYFPEFAFPVLAEATNARASHEDGSPLTVRLEDAKVDFLKAAIVDVAPDLYFGQSQTIVLRYDLPNQAPRAKTVSRANGAYITFPAYVIGDPGVSSIRIVVPDTFETSLVGDTMTRTTKDGSIIYTASKITNPNFFTNVVAKNDKALVNTRVQTGRADIRVRAWPGDETWSRFATMEIEKGLPTLIDLVGQPWPFGDRLEVIESVTPYLESYAGWFRLDDNIIEVGDELDAHTLLHELTHAWFNAELFDSRWIDEGFAEEISSQALAVLGEKAPQPKTVDIKGPGAVKLDLWDDPSFFDDSSFEREAFGYNAAYGVIHALAKELGREKVKQVISAATAKRIPYTGDPKFEKLTGRADWRRLLDYLEEIGGSTEADALFRTYVVSYGDQKAMDARTNARKTYTALAKAGRGWTPPLEVRQQMSAWQFASATTLMATSTAALRRQAALAAKLADVDVSLDALERSYESERIRTYQLIAGRAEQAGRALVDAHDALDSPNPLAAVGIRLNGGGSRFDAATAAFNRGAYADATSAANDARQIARDATTSGLQALLAMLAALTLVTVVGRWVTHHLARHRRAAAVPEGQQPVDTQDD